MGFLTCRQKDPFFFLGEQGLRYEVGVILLFLVSLYKVPFSYWWEYILGVLLGVQEIHTVLHMPKTTHRHILRNSSRKVRDHIKGPYNL